MLTGIVTGKCFLHNWPKLCWLARDLAHSLLSNGTGKLIPWWGCSCRDTASPIFLICS